MAERVDDLMAKGTVNVGIHKLVGYETRKRSVIGYIMNPIHSLCAFGSDIFLVRIQKYDHGS